MTNSPQPAPEPRVVVSPFALGEPLSFKYNTELSIPDHKTLLDALRSKFEEALGHAASAEYSIMHCFLKVTSYESEKPIAFLNRAGTLVFPDVELTDEATEGSFRASLIESYLKDFLKELDKIPFALTHYPGTLKVEFEMELYREQVTKQIS